MKNPYLENLRKSAKCSHRNKRNLNFANGIHVYHEYSEMNSSMQSWWDDVDFILNDYRVVVTWIHPRQNFRDYVESEASKSVAHLGPIGDIFNESKANYVKVGQSRKKVVSHTVSFTKESEERSKAYQLALEEIPNSTQYCAKPYIHTEWLSHGRFVDICAPIEVRGIDDLLMLANLVKRLLKRETTLESEFSDYIYSKQEWLAEGHREQINQLEDYHKLK